MQSKAAKRLPLQVQCQALRAGKRCQRRATWEVTHEAMGVRRPPATVKAFVIYFCDKCGERV